ncbi:MAG TPA: hypothetical protein VGM63_16750 [Mucilaginibacter sp.]
MIRSRYIYALLTLVIAFYFAPANAQNKTTTKNKKAPAKTVAKKTPPKATAKKLTAAKDTTKAKGNNPSSLTEEIIVTTAYKPVLADAVKIRRNPNMEDKTPFKAPLTYFTLDKRLERNTDIRQLDPMKMPKEQDSIPSNNYAKIGLGNLKTTFGEAYIDNGQDQALQVGGFAKHIAQSGSSIYKQNESRDEVGIFAKGITDDNTFSGRINYNRRGTDFYGFDPANPFPSFNPVSQHFNTISGEAEVTKNFKDVENEFTYALKVNGYSWDDAFQAKESNVVISGFLNETVKQFYAGLGASLDLSSQKDSTYLNGINNSIIRLNPYLKFQGDNYKIDAGLNLVREFGFSHRVFIFPAAKAELQVIPKYVRLFAEIKGDVDRSSLRDFSETNPFLNDDITIRNSVDKLDIAVGLKGTLAPGVGFKATIFRNTIENMPLFVNNFPSSNRFSVIYDDGNARVSGFNGELDVKISDDLDIFGRAEFKNYQMASEVEPWNLPKFTLKAGAIIHITKQLSINGTLLYRGNAFDRTVPIPTTLGGSTTTSFTLLPISSFADLSGGVEYRINNRFSIFGQVNNILNTNNVVWIYYPNYGFNVFGGVAVHF